MFISGLDLFPAGNGPNIKVPSISGKSGVGRRPGLGADGAFGALIGASGTGGRLGLLDDADDLFLDPRWDCSRWCIGSWGLDRGAWTIGGSLFDVLFAAGNSDFLVEWRRFSLSGSDRGGLLFADVFALDDSLSLDFSGCFTTSGSGIRESLLAGVLATTTTIVSSGNEPGISCVALGFCEYGSGTGSIFSRSFLGRDLILHSLSTTSVANRTFRRGFRGLSAFTIAGGSCTILRMIGLTSVATDVGGLMVGSF